MISVNNINPHYFCDASLFQVHQIHQVNLFDMRNQKVEYEGKCYLFLMSLQDFSGWFHWKEKLPSVKVELGKIYDKHGIPDLLQSDTAKEFKSSLKRYCLKNKIQMTKSRPYNLRASEQVERSQQSCKKVMYDLISQDRTGVNWARNLPQYMKCSSNEQREELGAKSPFEVYFGGTHNDIQKTDIQIRKKYETWYLLQLKDEIVTK